MAVLNYVPQLSDDLGEIKITYDREKKGVKLQVIAFRLGEERLVIEIMQKMARLMQDESFTAKWVTLAFKDQIEKRRRRFDSRR